MSISPVTFPPPDYYEMLTRFACVGATSAGIPTVAALTKAGYIESVVQITAAGKQFMKAEARRMRAEPPEALPVTIEWLATAPKEIRTAHGTPVDPGTWERLHDAKVSMLVEGGQCFDLVTWADSGDDVRKVRPEFRVRLTPRGLEAVARFDEQRAAERRSADRVLAMVEKGRVSEAKSE